MRKLISFFLSFFLSGFALAQTINTIAGGGPRNLQALQIGLAQPAGIAVDASGNIFVSLSQLHQIWKINTSSQVTVFAGDGSFTYNGDGGQAVSSTLNQPRGLAFDTAGNLYIADSGHNRVRKISAAGVISTVAGNGTSGFSGDGGSATSAQLSNPVAIAVDSSNNLYIVDEGNQRVRIVSPAGTINTFAGNSTATFAGDGGPATSASLNSPVGVAVDSSGSVYIADQQNIRIRKVIGGLGGNISTFAGNGTFGLSGDGGPATSAQLNTISGVSVDHFNNVYITEGSDVRAVASGSSTINTFAGGAIPGFSGDGGPPAAAKFANVGALTVDSSGTNIYIVDAGNLRIRKITSNVVNTFAGNGTTNLNGDGQAATNANFLTPNFVAVDNAGTLLFSDSATSSIKRLALASDVLTTLAGNGNLGLTPDGGSSTGSLFNPTAFNFDASGNIYFIEQNRIRKLAYGVYSTVANTANTSSFSGDGGLATGAQFQFPSALVRALNGDLYVADLLNQRVRMISASTGIVTTVVGNGTASSTGDNGLGVNATLNQPSSLSLDGAGNLYIGELNGNRIRKLVISSNIITTVAGDGTANYADGVAATATGLSSPTGVFADQSGNLFIADQGHSRVRKVTVGTNLISTVAGNGTYDFSGDGGPATSAAVNPLGVTVDVNQTLYIADSSGRIRTTGVTACFFTLSTPVVYLNKSAATGSVNITATNSSCPYAVAASSPNVTITSGASGMGSGAVTFSVNADPGTNRSTIVNVGGASFTVSQEGAMAQYNVGFFQPATPVFVLDSNGNGMYDAADKLSFFGGQVGATAVVGDWNGDGRSKIGYYLNGFWVLDFNGDGIFTSADKVYGFGSSDPSYIPVVGDWNGSGTTKIGYYHNGFWVLDMNGDGSFGAGDVVYGYGGNGPGEVPLVGDWNGDHRSKIGFFYNGVWALDNNGDGIFNTGDKYYNNFSYLAGDKPIVGDWSASGTTKIGIFRSGFWVLDYNGNGTYDGIGAGQDKFYAFGGNSGDSPIVADWNGDGRTKIGVYNSGFWTLDFNGNGMYDGVSAGQDRINAYGGGTGSQPIIGRW